MALLESMLKKETGKKDNVSFSVMMIHYSKLVPSEDNNYSVDKIEELANSILLSGGIKQNLLARKKSPDEYELIAGHRRRLAVKHLVEVMGHHEFAMVPVHVEKTDDTMSEINLILTNSGTRERSDWEKMMEVSRLTELVQALQNGTEEEKERFRQIFGVEPGVGGRELRALVAAKLGLSETKVANLRNIEKNLVPELKDKFKEGAIGVSAANAAASLPVPVQEELAEKDEIRIADVKEKSVSESDTEKCEELVSDSDTEKEMKSVSDSDTREEPNENVERDTVPVFTLEQLSAYGTPKKVYLASGSGTPGCESGTGGGYHCFCCHMECEIRGEECNCVEAPLGNPFPCEMVGHIEPLIEHIGSRCQFVNLDLANHTGGSGEPIPCCKECVNPCEYSCKRAMQAAAEKQQDEDNCCEKAEEVEAADRETEEQESMREEPLSDLELLRDMLERQNALLGKNLQTGISESNEHIRKQKLLVGALAAMVTDLEGMYEAAETEQPEFPKLKNDSQRKEWLRKYQAWGLWYEDEKIGVRYYKYDFDNGARLIVEEYTGHSPYEGEYTSSFFHLVGGPEPPKYSKYGFGRWNRHEKYSHHPDSETELIAFLKEAQKIG